jgi:hypothetical protein
MTKKLTLAAVPIAALAAAGAAVAHGTQGADSVTARFTATSITNDTTRSCATVASTSATYTGTATGSPGLTGRAVIVTRSTIDARNGMGLVEGTMKVGSTSGTFSAVYDNGVLTGTASGRDGSRLVVASLSATFSPSQGFTAGRLGGRPAKGAAVELPAGCGAPAPPKTVTGTIKADNASSITVGGLTCAVPARLAVTVAFQYPVGTRATIACAPSNGAMTLVRIEGKK